MHKFVYYLCYLCKMTSVNAFSVFSGNDYYSPYIKKLYLPIHKIYSILLKFNNVSSLSRELYKIYSITRHYKHKLLSRLQNLNVCKIYATNTKFPQLRVKWALHLARVKCCVILVVNFATTTWPMRALVRRDPVESWFEF